jgi:hypothetical protein
MMLPHTIGDSEILAGSVAANLENATIEVHVRRPDGTVVTSTEATGTNGGAWQAQFTAGDFDQLGWHELEVQVTFSDTTIKTIA